MGLLKIFQQNLHIYHRNDSTSLCTIHFIYILVLEDVIGSDVGGWFLLAHPVFQMVNVKNYFYTFKPCLENASKLLTSWWHCDQTFQLLTVLIATIRWQIWGLSFYANYTNAHVSQHMQESVMHSHAVVSYVPNVLWRTVGRHRRTVDIHRLQAIVPLSITTVKHGPSKITGHTTDLHNCSNFNRTQSMMTSLTDF